MDLIELIKQDVNSKGKALEWIDFICQSLRPGIYSEFPTMSESSRLEVEIADDIDKYRAINIISASLVTYERNNEEEDED